MGARAPRPLALPVGEEAATRGGWGVQLPQQDRVAARQEPMLLLLLLKQVAVAVAVVAVETRHGQAAVEKSLMGRTECRLFYQLSWLRRCGRANFKPSWAPILLPGLKEPVIAPRAPVSSNHLTYFGT